MGFPKLRSKSKQNQQGSSSTNTNTSSSSSNTKSSSSSFPTTTFFSSTKRSKTEPVASTSQAAPSQVQNQSQEASEQSLDFWEYRCDTAHQEMFDAKEAWTLSGMRFKSPEHWVWHRAHDLYWQILNERDRFVVTDGNDGCEAY